MIDDGSGSVEENDEDKYVDQDPNNILRQLKIEYTGSINN